MRMCMGMYVYLYVYCMCTCMCTCMSTITCAWCVYVSERARASHWQHTSRHYDIYIHEYGTILTRAP